MIRRLLTQHLPICLVLDPPLTFFFFFSESVSYDTDGLVISGVTGMKSVDLTGLQSMTDDVRREMQATLREMNNTVRVLKWYIAIMMGTFLLILRLMVAERHARCVA